MKKIKSYIIDFLFMVAGSCLYAIAINAFTAPNNIAPGGVTGIATLINYVFDTPIGSVVLLINIPIVIWSVVQIGYKLVLKTSVAILTTSFTLDLFATFIPAYHGDPILIAIFAGVFEGIGLCLVFLRGATTGGTDMVARVLSKKYRHISMGKLMLVLDGTIILASALVYNSIESAMYACIVVFVATSVIDAILYGTDAGTGKIYFVFSSKADVIADRILTDLDRGVTFLKSRGGYTQLDGEVLLCAVRRYEIFKINEIIHEVDKDAFVIVGDAGEITGQGFKSNKTDDKTLKELLAKVQNKRNENELTD
ncbi:MAG: YitT family protein [Clostridia bacterium]